jgi:hypothetical protein
VSIHIIHIVHAIDIIHFDSFKISTWPSFPHLFSFFTAFEKAKVEALDHAAYFLDLARQASELTKLMGDMGAVLLEQQMQQLLQDLSEKVWLRMG